MKICADTNVLVRAAVMDDPAQGQAAREVLQDASLIAVPLACLCEFVWVLRRVYRFDADAIATALRALTNTQNVVVNRPAVEAGLALLEAGGDFADGIIAFEGAQAGGEVFVSFDRQAVRLLDHQGRKSKLLP